MDICFGKTFDKYFEQSPLVLADVGAAGGLQPQWKRAEKILKVIAFEPDEEAFAQLMNSPGSSSVKYINVALHKDSRTVDFHVGRKRETSSIFQPNSRFLARFPETDRWDRVQTVQINTHALDDQLSEHQIREVDFIKVDAEGSDLFILQGATRILNESVFGLQIEVEFVPIYQEQPLFPEVDNFVKMFGFQLFDLRPIYWKRSIGAGWGEPKGQIIIADVLYLRDLDSFASLLEQDQGHELRKGRVLRAMAVCLVYGYLDYALELLDTVKGVFTESERQSLVNSTKGHATFASKLPNFRGRSRLSNILNALSKMIQPTYDGWALRPRSLGNVDNE